MADRSSKVEFNSAAAAHPNLPHHPHHQHHPPKASTTTASRKPSASLSSNHSKPLKQPCWFGAKCARKHRGCKFAHPPDDAPGATSTTRVTTNVDGGNSDADMNKKTAPPPSYLARPKAASPTNTAATASSSSPESFSSEYGPAAATATAPSLSSSTAVPQDNNPPVSMVDFMAVEEQLLQQAAAEAAAAAAKAAAAAPMTDSKKGKQHQHHHHHQQQQQVDRSSSSSGAPAVAPPSKEAKNHRAKRQKQPQPHPQQPKPATAASQSAPVGADPGPEGTRQGHEDVEPPAESHGRTDNSSNENDSGHAAIVADLILDILRGVPPVVAKEALAVASRAFLPRNNDNGNASSTATRHAHEVSHGHAEAEAKSGTGPVVAKAPGATGTVKAAPSTTRAPAAPRIGKDDAAESAGVPKQNGHSDHRGSDAPGKANRKGKTPSSPFPKAQNAASKPKSDVAKEHVPTKPAAVEPHNENTGISSGNENGDDAPPTTPPPAKLRITVPDFGLSSPKMPSALRNSPRPPSASGDAAASPPSPVLTPRRRASSVSFAPDVKDAAASEPAPATVAQPIATSKPSKKGGAAQQSATASAEHRDDHDNKEDATTGTATGSAENSDAPPDEEESEADKKKRRMEEIRRQQALAAEKKKQKKKSRHDKYLQELEESAEKRKAFWAKLIEKEEAVVDRIMILCETEFCRSYGNNLTREALASGASRESRDDLRSLCQEAYHALFRDEIPSKVTVKDPKLPDWNGRDGVIEFWDSEKGKFYVGLETRKGKNVAFQYIGPESLEAHGTGPNRKAKSKSDSSVFRIYVHGFYNGKYLMLNLNKDLVDKMNQATSFEAFLDWFVKVRDHRDAEAKRQAEQEEREEAERRKRRAEKQRREAEEWERRQREFAAEKERMREARRQYRRGNSCGPRCNCQRCAMERHFAAQFFHIPGGPSFFFAGPRMGGFGLFEDFGEYDSDSGDEDDEWDRQWNRKHEEELQEKNDEAASTLGVAVDASATEIKRAYRAKARMYHPDSYRPEYHVDGTTKEEAEEQFKKISDAYDHLMSNLED